MDTQIRAVGLLEVEAPAGITVVDESLVVDFGAQTSAVRLELNGRQFEADSPTGLVAAIEAHRRVEADRLISIPYEVAAEGSRVIIGQDGSRVASLSGAYLTGRQAQLAADKADRVVCSTVDAWPAAPNLGTVNEADLDGLAGDSRWDGPLVVSMPRTGSTLMGILFLFCRDPDSATGYRFDRYIHEPVAPVFWRGDEVESVTRFLTAPLSGTDVVQESAYQFADPRIARWFLRQALPPVVFTMRHPQLAWPSRWRAMVAKDLAEQPEDAETSDLRVALADDDFSGLGRYLTTRVRPADNGFFAFVSLLDMCLREGIDFVIVDNTRFRDHPEPTLRELCARLHIDFDPAMTEWTGLGSVLPRVVMSDLARGDEYQWYYAGTLGSDNGIRPETHMPLDPTRFPEDLRGVSNQHLTIDEAVTWYHLLLARPETLADQR